MDNQSFVVTREWIFQHRQCSGLWTAPQIEALGFSFPPPNGWLDSVVGTEISADQVRRFESQSPAKATRHVLVSKPRKAVGTEPGLVGPVNGSYSTEGGGRRALIPRRRVVARNPVVIGQSIDFRYQIPFGRFRGWRWVNLPKKYLKWLLANNKNKGVQKRCKIALGMIQAKKKDRIA